MQTKKLLLLLFLFCSACESNDEAAKTDIKFDRSKWDTKDGATYTYRKQMINDLIKNYKWPGVKKDSVVKLLGQPNEIEEDTFMIYDYHQNPLGLFEFSGKSLVFELSPDNTVKLARPN
jgi:hypothetical protein